MTPGIKGSRATHDPQSVVRHTALRGLRSRVATILLAAAMVMSSHAQMPKANADQVQAAYLYNFGKFVKWPAVAPANQSGAFIICVLDRDPFGATLQSTLSGETVAGRPVVVKRLAKAQEADACHILFIGASQARDLKGILSAVDDAAVLTVSDMPDFSKRGGMIQFVVEDDRIRFEINLEGAERAHLIFPSELLKVAAIVRKPGRAGE